MNSILVWKSLLYMLYMYTHRYNIIYKYIFEGLRLFFDRFVCANNIAHTATTLTARTAAVRTTPLTPSCFDDLFLGVAKKYKQKEIRI